MVEHAKAEFHLNQEMEDGCTLRDHLNVAWEATGKKPDDLFVPPLPLGTRYLWDIFIEIRKRSSGSGFGAARISFQDMQAWQNMRHLTLNIWEQAAIEAVDDAYINSVIEQDKAKRKK